MDISLQFRDDTLAPTDFEQILSRIHIVTNEMAALNPKFATWYAQGDSLEEAKLYQAFDDGKPSAAILAVLKHEFSSSPSATFVALWDGDENSKEGATLACHVHEQPSLNSFEISLFDPTILSSIDAVQRIVRAAVTAFHPAYVTVAPRRYVTKQVFDTKPGVGWMLYLPTVITQRQVPEARELIAVPEAGKAQTGTILVSVLDGQFSMKNPEHIESANRIEVRLVDQDLLPAFADL
ncbi:immunity 52 family protein [Burkholderia multivorans]|uniref:immunity 52 family protein n=1 Tax=Burkholderia multivorans TaxID=87883 RepID=UPI000277D963|nr:immunity 52 family protein [Burkholderia multivorans]AJY18176.1 immunity 32 family protein [Burkholderia multivorans ATCC BAA-247]AVR22500.1 LysR family transcriptional regulator [Burkholderia multivorans]EJO63338.1 hypothetical protein BURMUCF1_1996 [Burkholderia multivorans ATCC BAA-247]MBU9494166.1 immunity 52 family protein [Burkholderia multivorans]MCO1435939.1 immunity 52 family protein [Burkholderia multivorans]